MSRAIYLLQADQSIIELRQSGYLTEADLQDLLGRDPRLLGGEDLSWPRRFLLVRREAGLPSSEDTGARWSLDHLFLDQSAIPTIVEVKRSSDTRIRREVVGQMLDYAANAVVYLPIDRIRGWFEDRCTTEGTDPTDVIHETLGPEIDPDGFWAQAALNLQAGRIRLMFVADEIPSELQRIVEFLNRQMNPAEVLAVEVAQFVGQGVRTLVPRVVGLTADAARAKGTTPGVPPKQWNEEAFFERLQEREGGVQIGLDLQQWAREHGARISWGKGGIEGSMRVEYDAFSTWYPLFFLWTDGKLQLQLGTLKNRPALADDGVRRELSRRLNAVPGLSVAELPDLYPSLPPGALSDPKLRTPLLDAFAWVIQVVRDAWAKERSALAVPPAEQA